MLCSALFFPLCRERWEKGDVRPEEHRSRGSDGGGALGAVYGAAALPACSALRCSSRCAGKGGRKGKSGRRSIQCSCLENPRDGGAWWAAIYGVPQSRTQLK